jgi:hypothetical protein
MSKQHTMKAYWEDGGEAPPLAKCKGANVVATGKIILSAEHWFLVMLAVSSHRAASGEESQFVSGLVAKIRLKCSTLYL